MRPSFPTHLQGALEGVLGFGKVKREATQTRPEMRHEGENSNLTVTGTGMEQEEWKGECVQAVESVGAGDGI